MSLTVEINPAREYELLSEGLHSAVLADVVDLGVLPNPFGEPKAKIQFVWLTSEVDERGYTKRAFARYTKSLHEKASLTKALRQLRVVVPANGSFNLESLVGRQAQLVIQHNQGTDGKTYANIASIMAPGANQNVEVPADFKRKDPKTAAKGQTTLKQPIADDDIPF